MTNASRWAVMLLRDKFARRGGSGSRASEHDDACQKKQRAGRDDADDKDGKSTTFQVSSFTCIALSTHTCDFLICSHGRYFEPKQTWTTHGRLMRCRF
jgi:hypothetical protein